MNKIIKLLGIFIGIVVFVILAAVIIIPLVFDPNDHKDKIAALVKDNTGRDLNIEDDMDLSVFPWLGIALGKVSFGNAEGFGPEPFARIDSAKVHLKLLPLLKQQVEIDTVSVHGLALNLQIDKQGISNWADLTGEAATPPATSPAPPSPVNGAPVQQAPTPGQTVLAGLAIGGIDIRDARLLYHDQSTNSRYLLTQLSLASGPIRLQQAFDIDTAFTLESTQPAMNGHVELSSRISLDLNNERYHADNTRLKSQLSGDTFPGGKIDLDLQANINADLGQQLVNIEKLSLKSMGINLSGKLSGKQIIDKPVFQGALKIAEFNPRQLMNSLAIDAPETSDAAALGKAQLDLAFEASMDSLQLNKLAARIDDTGLDGTLSIKDFTDPAITARLAIDMIDLDRYLPPQQETAAATPAAAATAGVIELPVETLRALNLDANATIGKLKMSNLNISDVTVTAAAHEGLIKLFPVGAKLYGGSYQGNIQLDARGDVPAFAIDEKMSGFNAGPFLQDLMDYDFIRGVADWKIKLTTQGASLEDIRKTLSGSASFKFQQGGIKDLDLVGLISEDYQKYAKALLKDKEKIDTSVFRSLSASVKIKYGLASTNDLRLDSAQLDVKGRGTADLVKEQLDLTLDTTPVGEFADLLGKELKGHTIPVTIKGPFASPDIKTGIDKLLGQVAKEKIEAELNKQEARAKKKLEEEKARLEKEKARIEEQLKREQQQQEEALKKKAEEELKKGLDKLFR